MEEKHTVNCPLTIREQISYSQNSSKKPYLHLFHTVDQCLSDGSCAGGDGHAEAHCDGDGSGQGAVVGVKRTPFLAVPALD